MSLITIQTSVNPGVFRQALELVLGKVTTDNLWWISTSGDQASVNSSLDQEVLQNLVTFLEATPDFDPQFYTFVDPIEVFKENVHALKEDAKAKIDVEAGVVRSKYLTSIPGQDATYIAKEVDCRAFKAASYPADTSTFQWVQSEADATGLTPTEAADAIILQADQWRVLGSTIEKIRRGGKIEIDKKLKASTIKASLAATLAALQSL